MQPEGSQKCFSKDLQGDGHDLGEWWMSLLGREKNTPKLEAGVSMASAREQRRMPGAVTYTRGLTQQGE